MSNAMRTLSLPELSGPKMSSRVAAWSNMRCILSHCVQVLACATVCMWPAAGAGDSKTASPAGEEIDDGPGDCDMTSTRQKTEKRPLQDAI